MYFFTLSKISKFEISKMYFFYITENLKILIPKKKKLENSRMYVFFLYGEKFHALKILENN